MEEPQKPDASELVTDERAKPDGEPAEAPADPAATRKKAILGLVAAIAIGAAATGIAYYAETATGAVATVDGARVSKPEYERLFAQTKRQYGQRFNVDFATPQGKQMEGDLKAGLMNQLVERELIRAEARKRGIEVPDEAFQAKLAEIKKGFKDEAEFEKQLAANGLDRAGFERQVRDMLEVERVVDSVTKDAQVTDAEVRAYYDQNRKMYDRPEEVRARHILVKDETTAKMVHRKALTGDFAALAKQYSEDPGSKASGGDLGYFGRGRMVKEFEDAAFSLPIGKVSPLVKTQFGWHVLKVEDRKAPRTQPFEEVQAEIRQNLLSERRRTAFGSWLQARRAEAKIVYKDGYEPPARPQGAPGGDDGHGHGPGDGHGH